MGFMRRLLSAVLTGLFFSCSLLEDSAVSSTDDFEKKLKSITILQVLQNEIRTRVAQSTESAISNITPEGLVLTKEQTITFPEITNDWKFKFRSGVTGTGVVIKNRFFANGKVYSCQVYKNNNEMESYIVQYNSKNQPDQLITTIYNGGTSIITTDNLQYDNLGYPGNIIRSSNDPAKEGTFELNKSETKPCNTDAFNFVFQEHEYVLCDSNELFRFPDKESVLIYTLEDNLLQEVQLTNQNNATDTKCCSDIYYFHPVLVFPFDSRHRILYAPDWWLPQGNMNNENGSTSATLKFKHGS
jgi:hypothetical protein